MNLHLYYCPGTCSFVPHVALELVKESSGQNFDGTVINLKNGEHLKPEYKAINPRGQVPALIVDGKLITQVMAITGFLHDSFPKAQIFPTDAMAKAQAVSILAWMNNTVHPTFTRVFRSERFGDEAGKAGVKAMALEAFKGYLAEIDGLVSQGQTYICGDQLTPADIYAIAFIRWGGLAGINPANYPNYQAYASRIAALPVVERIMKKEGINLNTFAG
ncbi:MAG: glutathione S-transferase family protein [Polynucleobacter victoriensis]